MKPIDVSSSDAVKEMYADILKRLQSRLEDVTGMIIDAPCSSGHMLSMYHETCDSQRPLFGVDLSPQMVEITQQRLGGRWTARNRCLGGQRHD